MPSQGTITEMYFHEREFKVKLTNLMANKFFLLHFLTHGMRVSDLWLESRRNFSIEIGHQSAYARADFLVTCNLLDIP